MENESNSSDKSDSETESLSPSKRKRKDQEYEPTDDESSLSESEDEVDEHEEEVLQEDGFVVPAHVDMDEEEYALQQVLRITDMSFKVFDQHIKAEAGCIENQLFSFTTLRFYLNKTVCSIFSFQENGCVNVASA